MVLQAREAALRWARALFFVAMQTGRSRRMLICMRTTLNLPDGLMQVAKARAAQDGRTVTSLIEEGLRLVLARSQEQQPVTLPAYGSGDGAVLVDLDDRAALAESLEDDS